MSIYKMMRTVRIKRPDGSRPDHSNHLYWTLTGFLAFTLLLTAVAFGQDFKMEAWSKSGLGRAPMVLLTWPQNTRVQAFNLYRRTAAETAYGEKPVNSAPIAVLRDCDEIKTIIPATSEEWKEISTVLQTDSGSGGGGIRDEGHPFQNDVKDPKKQKQLKTAIQSETRFAVMPSPIRIRRFLGFDPCQLYTVRPDSRNGELLQMLARRFYKIAQVIGQAYVDDAVTIGTTYYYEIRGLRDGREEILASNVRVVAGTDTPLPAPLNVQAIAGDSRVMVSWDSVASTTGYDVFRRTMPAGSWIKVNAEPVMVKMTADLNNDSLAVPVYGLIDYRRWDEATGLPDTHEVDGAAVDGPANKTTYRYRVSARNALGTPGTPSAETASVTPTDQTRPGLPMDLKAESVGQDLKLSWSKVTLDELGRIEEDGVKGYDLYRCASQTDTAGTKINTSLILQPALVTTVAYTDVNPAGGIHYGDAQFFYRLRSHDNHSHVSVFSATATGIVPDIFPPDPPKNVAAEGFQHYIRVCWTPNSEPDLESYMLYRSLCNYGRWTPPDQERKTGVNCGPFVLITEMTKKEAEDSLARYGKICFNDASVPAASPLCYAYWVKAKDKSQNESGQWPYPNLTAETVVCQRLLDETPPPLPIVSGMQAQDNAIKIDWISAPIQDLGAFHVYRAEKEGDPYIWVGGMTVVKPPAVSTPLTTPFKPAKPCGCDSIPLVAHSGMKSGSFIDKKVEAKKIYWYKVTSVDQNGNDAKPDSAVPYSTFTFRSAGPAQPVITSPIGKSSGHCGLEIKWTPAFSATTHMGFIVFRSGTEAGPYYQLGAMLKTNAFIDSMINAKNVYWYKIQAFDFRGRPSALSLPQQGRYE